MSKLTLVFEAGLSVDDSTIAALATFGQTHGLRLLDHRAEAEPVDDDECQAWRGYSKARAARHAGGNRKAAQP